MTLLPQQETIDQYVADGVETAYIYSFLIPTEVDIAVYLTPSGQEPNPTADIQSLNVDYTVSGEGVITGGTITFLVAPPLGTTVTLVRNIQFSIQTSFSNAQTISGVNLDNAFQRVTLMAQQLNTFYQDRGLQYLINQYIPPSTTPVRVPVLGDQEVWQGTATGEVIAVTFEENVDVSALRSQLASEVQNSDGAQLVGYYDELNNVGSTLAMFLNQLPAYISAVVSGLVPTIGYQTGDVKPSLNPVALSGWIIWSDGTIGSASSGGTIRANADTQPLFEMLWDNYSDAACPVSGGRGASSTADFVANKAIALPGINGRTLVNLTSTYTPGQTFGLEEVSLTLNQMPAHEHAGSYLGTTFISCGGGNSPVYGSDQNSSRQLQMASEGSGVAHENRQPSVAVYHNIKL